jgi:hypothetical protein
LGNATIFGVTSCASTFSSLQKEILIVFFERKLLIIPFSKRDSNCILLKENYGEFLFPKKTFLFPSFERKLLLILFQKEILLSFFGEKTIGGYNITAPALTPY